MSVLLHVSDPHFGTERHDVVEALVRAAHDLRPDLVVLSGDVTQRARRRQFDAARRFFDRLPAAPLLAIPGNHDIPLFNVAARVAAPYRGFQRAFGAQLEPEFAAADLLVLGVNTTRWWRHKHGTLGAAQVDRVAARLRAANPAQVRVVVTHQPVHVVTDDDRNNLARGHARAVEQWTRAGADIVLGGHIHRAHAVPLGDLWSVLAGTAVSRRVRAGRPNSVNVIRVAADRCAIERWDHGARDGFACAQAIEVRLPRLRV